MTTVLFLVQGKTQKISWRDNLFQLLYLFFFFFPSEKYSSYKTYLEDDKTNTF